MKQAPKYKCDLFNTKAGFWVTNVLLKLKISTLLKLEISSLRRVENFKLEKG